MVAKSINKRIIDLKNVDLSISNYLLNIATGEREFYKGKNKTPNFHGVFFEDEKTFFALYSSISGPKIFYQGKEYDINKELNVCLTDRDGAHKFTISEYGINIVYKDSDLLDWDWWSTRDGIDIFYILDRDYKTDEFYDWYTLKE
jgi:hypothetical protein